MHQAGMAPPAFSRGREEAHRIPAASRVRSLLLGIARRLPLGIGFCLLSLAQCAHVPSPYAICFLAALLAAGQKPRGAVGGLAAGLVLRLANGLPLDEWQFAACLLCFPLLKTKPKKDLHLSLLTGALLLGRAIPGMAFAPNTLTVILYLASILIGAASSPALYRAALILKRKAWAHLTADDLLCLSLPGLFMLSGAGRLMVFQVNVGYAAAAFAVLLLSWLAGGAAGACAGMGCGTALALGGQNALLLILLSLGALAAGLFQGKNRLLCAGVFLLTAVTATYLIAYGFSLSLFLSGAAGCALFCLTPSAWTQKAGVFLRRLRWAQPRENAYIRLKMHRWVRAIECMADALPHPRPGDGDGTADGTLLGEWLCEDCERKSVCWQEQREQTEEALRALADESAAPEEELRRINQSFSSCLRIGKIPALLARLEDARQQRVQKNLCAEYEREMLQTHLTALSQAAQQISLEGMSGNEEEAFWTAQAEETLQAMHFPGQAAFVKRIDGRLTVCLRCEPLSLRPADSHTLAKRLGLRLHADFAVTEQQGDRIVLEELPPLRLLTGIATISAAGKEKRSALHRTDNGDAVLARPLPGGQELLALSDGMGHGADAQDESRKTLELLSLCMEAGYSRRQAITAVNGSMLSATSGEKFATVDLCLINLWTGETAMNKLGACESFLIQGQKIKTIEGAALPLGILEHVVPMEHTFSLGSGDTLILMSDGVADAFGQAEGILKILREKRDASPQHLADQILRQASLRRDGLPSDDMTVLCARVEEREENTLF